MSPNNFSGSAEMARPGFGASAHRAAPPREGGVSDFAVE
jgi:hypothetical protein